MKICPWAEKLRPISDKIGGDYAIGHEMLLKLSKDVNKKSKSERQVKKGLCIAQLNDKLKDACVLSLLIYRERAQDGRGREWEDKGKASGRFCGISAQFLGQL